MNNIELRDYFAGQALSGLMANAHLQKEFLKDAKAILKDLLGEDLEPNSKITVASYLQYHHAMISYAFADGMIEEREKKKTEKDIKK